MGQDFAFQVLHWLSARCFLPCISVVAFRLIPKSGRPEKGAGTTCTLWETGLGLGISSELCPYPWLGIFWFDVAFLSLKIHPSAINVIALSPLFLF